jgi:hypothetical protein
VSAADAGLALVALGSGATLVWLVAELPDGGSRLRRVGRVALRLGGPPTRPVRAAWRRLTEEPAATCARRGHRVLWDGHAEWCRRCGVSSYPALELPDPRVRPSPLRWRLRVELDDAAVAEWLAALDRRSPDVGRRGRRLP